MPRWVVSVDALWLERSVGSNNFLGYAAYNVGGTPSGLVTDNLYSDDTLFPLVTGLRVQLGARINDQLAVEATYWGLQQWSAGNSIYGGQSLYGDESILISSPWLQIPVMDNVLTYSYNSEVQNVEINERLGLPTRNPFWDASFLWGVRYFHLAETFNLSGSDIYSSSFENLYYKTTNDLVGAQIGLQSGCGWDRWHLSTEAKVGLFANIYTAQGTDSITGPYGAPWQASQNGTGLSALFEVSFLLHYRLADHFALRAGYQGYGVTGLALAPRQLADFSHGGTVWLDGLSLGLESSW